MGIFNKNENKEKNVNSVEDFVKEKKVNSVEDFVELKKIEAKDIIDDFEEKANFYPLVSDSNLYYNTYYKLNNLEFEIKSSNILNKNEEEIKTIVDDDIKKMESISSEFIKNCLSNDMKIKENAENMRNFTKKRKRFFVIEPLFDSEENDDVYYCFSYNVRYDLKNNKLCCLALHNRKQNAEYLLISPADYKVREMNEFDFGEYADIRFSAYKTINEETFLCDRYKKLHDMFLRDSTKNK